MVNILMLLVNLGVALSLASYSSPSMATSIASYNWLQFAKGSDLVARSIVGPDDECPNIIVDERTVRMTERENKYYKKEFPIKVCQSFINADKNSVTFADGSKIKIPRKADKVAIIGDSGCHDGCQDCHNNKSWPASRIANSILSHKDLDFVIHVGDYVYNTKSIKSLYQPSDKKFVPHGNDWATAEFEIFKPFGNLLRNTPILLVRGNHEDCPNHYGGAGWFTLFDVSSEHVSRCKDIMPPYHVDIADNTRFLIYDSSAARDSDWAASAPRFDEFVRNMKILRKYSESSAHENILLTHRPIFSVLSTGMTKSSPGGVDKCGFATDKCGFATDNYLLRSAAGESGLFGPALNMIISGHVHQASMLSFDNPLLPMQVVIGNSGATLYNLLYDNASDIIGCRFRQGQGHDKDPRASNFYYNNSHGFTIMNRTGHTKKQMIFYDHDNNVLSKCNVDGKQFSCS